MGYLSMKGKAAVVAAAAVFVLAVAQLQTAAYAAEFDYFVLALQWPGNSCRNISSCCPDNGCCPGYGRTHAPNQFTIHGLWPEYDDEDSKWPSCCSDERFDPKAISPLNWIILSEVWPSYRCDSETTCNGEKSSFLAAQYEKHGTCAAPIIKGQYEYFTKATTLYTKYDVTKVLNDAGIVASVAPYPIMYILDELRRAFHAMPKITCAEDGVVKEIWLCFDKDFNPRNCAFSLSCPTFVRLLPTDVPDFEPVGEGAIPRMAKIAQVVI
ncbi:ribonuclease 2-like [Momordica charantia]|uniref:Ribonuclease 2-like n=1 Tax=Momordica charantia TaxID=3673 RepID=A0A6J1CIK8_MOMCH|nr:ribonuclease 2-like [Momordica charantia]